MTADQRRIVSIFGLFAAGFAGLLVALGIGNSLDSTTRNFMFVTGVGSSILAMLLSFNYVVAKMEIKWQVPEDLQDDWEDIRAGRLTWATGKAVVTLLSIFVLVWLLFDYDKFVANWHGVNVLFVSIVVGALTAVGVSRTTWFQDKSFQTPGWVFMIALGGFLVAPILGIYFTEPLETSGLSRNEMTEEQRFDNSRAGTYYRTYYYTSSNTNSGGTTFVPDIKCSGKGCGYGVLLALFVIVVLILIVGSALIYNFWVFAMVIFLVMMTMIAIHRLRWNPKWEMPYTPW